MAIAAALGGNWIKTGKEACIKLVNPEDLRDYWEIVVPYLERGRTYWQEYYDLKDIYIDIFAGNKQLWLVGEFEESFGCFITEFRSFPKAKVFAIVYAGAEKDNVDKLTAGDFYHEFMLIWAKQNGATHARIEGRKGWEKIGKQLGYDLVRVALIKNLQYTWRH